MHRPLIERFRAARRGPALAVLEGFHPLKHALRFDALIEAAVAPDVEKLEGLARHLAPDLAGCFADVVTVVTPEVFAELAPVAPESGVIALARRPAVDAPGLVRRGDPPPLLLLENPTHPGNLGAAVRVAAAAGAAGVLTTGRLDPWHPAALRGAAGLHFALPVVRVDALPSTARPLIALHPEGEPIGREGIPDAAILAFGSERRGLSRALLERAEQHLAIPMRPGVSSLNLATAVAVSLYAWRLHAGEPHP